MTPDSAATTSSTPGTQAPAPDAPTPQAAVAGSAPGPQPASVAPLPPVQILWEVATLALGLLARIVNVLQPIQARYPKQAWQVARLLIDIPRILLTIRHTPERVTMAQLRHLTRARHILQALFNYTLPTLGPQTSSSAAANSSESPLASTENATPPRARKTSSATTAIREVPEVPEVPAVLGIAATPASPGASQVRQFQSHLPLSTIGNPQSAIPDSYASHSSQSSHSAFAPYIPDFHTLSQALKSNTLPPNCAGALVEEPGDALVKALRQLHAVYFSLFPNQPPKSPSQPSGNLQSTICNLQSGTPQPDAPSVHPVHNVHPVHSPSPAQSEISNLKSEIPSPQSNIPHSAFRIPHSSAPP